ncbi:MAG: tRNA (guanosine(46)-N7)-methyltransferase TrmB [Clostridia bacterium]|nr:tRNA (guanosine(46)-N7)-methyltransferase TrmB [Clostridia bacterium]
MRLKKVKGAMEKVESSKYYVNSPTKNKGIWKDVFKNENPIHIEIGMGKGNFIINMAKKHPEINFIGIEMYDSVLVRAIQSLENEKNEIVNLKLLLLDAINIDTVFDKEIEVLYLNFSDPWPKAKHAKRRLTSQVFLDKYDTIFKDKNTIIQKTDNIDLFNFSVEMLKEKGYNLIEVTNDLQALNDEDNVLTEYEAKFMEKDIKINRLKAIK